MILMGLLLELKVGQVWGPNMELQGPLLHQSCLLHFCCPLPLRCTKEGPADICQVLCESPFPLLLGLLGLPAHWFLFAPGFLCVFPVLPQGHFLPLRHRVPGIENRIPDCVDPSQPQWELLLLLSGFPLQEGVHLPLDVHGRVHFWVSASIQCGPLCTGSVTCFARWIWLSFQHEIYR